jgi:hypothetical protein
MHGQINEQNPGRVNQSETQIADFWDNTYLPYAQDNLCYSTVSGYQQIWKLEWKTLYAGRRGAGTVLTELTGSAIAAQQILRHKKLAVTTGFYVRAMAVAGLEGMKLLEQKALSTSDNKKQ